MSKRTRTNRGRNLKRTESQAQLEVSRRVTNERARTDGRESIGAVATPSLKLKRKKPREHVSANMTKADLTRESIPTGAQAHVTRDGRVRMLTYTGESIGTAQARESTRKTRESDYRPRAGHEHGTAQARGIREHGLGIAREALDKLAEHDRERDTEHGIPGTFKREHPRGYLAEWLAARERESH